MQRFALTTSHFGQFSQHLRRVADIFSSFQCEGLESTLTKRTGSSLKQQRAARGSDRSTARRPGPSVRGVATWRRQDIACFSGPTYTNPPQIRKRKVCVIFAPPNFQLRLDHFPWLEHRRSRWYMGVFREGRRGVRKVLNHPLGLTGEVVIYRHRCGVRFAPR